MGWWIDGSFQHLTILTFLPLIHWVKSTVYLAYFSTSNFIFLLQLRLGLSDFEKLGGVKWRERCCSFHCCPLFHLSPFQARASPSPQLSLSCLLHSCLSLCEVTAAEWPPRGNIFSISHLQWYVLAIAHSLHHPGILSAKVLSLLFQCRFWCGHPILLKSLERLRLVPRHCIIFAADREACWLKVRVSGFNKVNIAATASLRLPLH